jgi:DNA-binding transcriptional LysR family regulator
MFEQYCCTWRNDGSTPSSGSLCAGCGNPILFGGGPPLAFLEVGRQPPSQRPGGGARGPAVSAHDPFADFDRGGPRLFRAGVAILADLAEADLSVSQLQLAPRGRLRVNAPMSFGFLHLAPAIPDFLCRYPELEVDMVMNDRFVDLVDEGFDVAVRIGRLEDSSLVARKLAPARRVICGSPAYLQARGVPDSPDDLKTHECLCYSNVAVANEWHFVAPDGRPWPVEVKGRLSTNNGDALVAAALKGLGLVSQPTFLAGRHLQDGALITVLDKFVPQEAAVRAVYPHSRHLSPKVRAFVDFLVERFGPRPYWDDPLSAGQGE